MSQEASRAVGTLEFRLCFKTSLARCLPSLHSLAFRFPPTESIPLSLEATHNQLHESNASGSGAAQSGPALQAAAQSAAAALARHEDELATLLQPDIALWRKPFELMVDNVLYIGVPMPCRPQWSARPRRQPAASSTQPPAPTAGSQPQAPQTRSSSDESAQLADEVAASLFRVQPTKLEQGAAAASAPPTDKADLDMFHVVFVLDVDKVHDDSVLGRHSPPPTPGSGAILKSAVIDTALRVAHALQAENSRSAYMTKQVQQLLEARAAWLAASPTALRDATGHMQPSAVAPLHPPAHSRTLSGSVQPPPLRSTSSNISERGGSVPPPTIYTGGGASGLGAPPPPCTDEPQPTWEQGGVYQQARSWRAAPDASRMPPPSRCRCWTQTSC